MNKKKTLLMSATATTVGVAMFAGIASAQTPSVSGDQSLVDKIAQKFNLDKQEVQKVFNEEKEVHRAERQQKLEDRLDKAVEEGKITVEQKTAILEKLEEFHAYLESIKGKDREEHRKLMRTKHEELKKWAEEQGLQEYLPLVQKGSPGQTGERPARIKFEL